MIYFDHNASSPPSKKHYKKVLEVLSSYDANPSSIHSAGRKAKLLLEESREQIASLLGAQGKNIIFCAGASEANNLALYYLKLKSLRENNQICVLGSKLDHPSLRTPLEKGSFNFLNLKLDSTGVFSAKHLEEILTEKTISFASLTYVNGETGLINPVLSFAEKIKARHPECHIHIDAVQALGKINLENLHASEADSASFSAHKIGGLKGIGCLYVKEALKKKIVPMIEGGSQENGLRAGTENLIGAISFSEATKEANPEACKEFLLPFKEKILTFIKKNKEDIALNLDLEKCIPNTFNLHIKKIPMEKVLLHFERRGILLSTKSACSSGISGPSETLKALGLSDHAASNSFRLSLAKSNTLEEVDFFLKTLEELFK